MANQDPLLLPPDCLVDFVKSLRRTGAALVTSPRSLPIGAPIAIVADGPDTPMQLNTLVVSQRPADREGEPNAYIVRALTPEEQAAFTRTDSAPTPLVPSSESTAATAEAHADAPSLAARSVELTAQNVRELAVIALGRRGILALGQNLRHGQRLQLGLQRDGVEVAQLCVQVTGQVTLDGKRSVLVRAATDHDRARLENTLNVHARAVA